MVDIRRNLRYTAPAFGSSAGAIEKMKNDLDVYKLFTNTEGYSDGLAESLEGAKPVGLTD